MRTRRGKARKSFLDRQRQHCRLAASRQCEEIVAKLQAHLSDEAWEEVQARWDARPELYLPEQKRDFFIAEAVRLDLLDLVPVAALVAA